MINADSLKQLFGNLIPNTPITGIVGHYLENHKNENDFEISLIHQLTEQIRTIWTNKTYAEIADPYKISARILVLTYLLKYYPIFNCMSGKDRTGMLDIEAKFLLTCAYLTGTIPEPNTPFSYDQQMAYTALALFSGNLEVQRWNTGVGGSKSKYTDPDPILPKFLNSTARLWHLGGHNIFKKPKKSQK